MPMETRTVDGEDTEVFVCGTCGSDAIESWPYVHCWKCGAREDRPDLGLTAEGQPASSGGAVFGGGTPDSEQRLSQSDQPAQDYPPGWTKDENGEWVQTDNPPANPDVPPANPPEQQPWSPFAKPPGAS